MQVYELITCVRRANENAGNLISLVQFLINIYIYIYGGYIHELFVWKPERVRYERHSQEKFGGAAAKKAAKSEKLFECNDARF